MTDEAQASDIGGPRPGKPRKPRWPGDVWPDGMGPWLLAVARTIESNDQTPLLEYAKQNPSYPPPTGEARKICWSCVADALERAAKWIRENMKD